MPEPLPVSVFAASWKAGELETEQARGPCSVPGIPAPFVS